MTNLLQPMPMERMVEHVARELEMTSTVFSVSPGYRGTAAGVKLPFGSLDLPLGVAPGPHGLLAQNLLCAYVAGARFLSLATLGSAIPKLTLGSDGVCLRKSRGGAISPRQAAAEAVKGNVLIQLLCRELGLGDPQGVCFAMSLPPEKSFLERGDVEEYLDTMADASRTELWQNCLTAVKGAVSRFNNIERDELDDLAPHISNVARVEAPKNGDFAGVELLLKRGIHVLLRFDLSWSGEEALEAVLPALRDLAKTAAGHGVTLEVEVSGSLNAGDGEVLSGVFLASQTLRLAARLAALCPELPLHYADGVDQLNIARLAAQGFQTMSVCTTLLKPGGYLRLRQMARTLAALRTPALCEGELGGINGENLLALANTLEKEPHYQRKTVLPRPRKPGKPPVTDCFTAPCQTGCPFGEDIPGALRLMSDGRLRDALQVILDRNPLPHITGTFCHQPCRERCTRVFYDEAVNTRETEILCANAAWEDLLARMETPEHLVGQRIAVLGGGVSAMAVAFLFARRGVPVSLFEGETQLGGALRRKGLEAAEAIDLDAQLLDVMEVDIRLGAATPEPSRLLKTGYSHVVDARETLKNPKGEGADQLFLDEENLAAEDAAQRIFTLGDGAGDIPDAIAAAHRVVDGLLGPAKPYPHPSGRRGGAMGKKGKVWLSGEAGEECHRCLECATVCECCVDVCPNRANVPITVLTKRRPQILHLDAQCHACGLCASFCPYEGAPYRDKFTLFETTEAFTKSDNDGFVVLDFLSRKVRLRLNSQVRDASLQRVDLSIPGEIQELMETIFTDYPYLLDPNRRKTDDQVTLWT